MELLPLPLCTLKSSLWGDWDRKDWGSQSPLKLGPSLPAQREALGTERTGGAHLEDERLIRGSWRVQPFRAVEGALVLKHGPREEELPRPVDAPAPRQVVLLMEAPDGEVTGGHLQLLHFDASGSRGDDDHRVIF